MIITQMPENSALVKQMRESLEALASSSNESLRLAAKDILSGRSDITSLLSAPGIDEAFDRGMTMYKARQASMTDEERRQEVANEQRQIDELQADPLFTMAQRPQL